MLTDSVRSQLDLIQDDEWMEAWKRKRWSSFIGFIVMGTLAGIDSSVIFNTLFSYLKDLIKTKTPELYYSMIVTSFYVALGLSGVIFGRLADKTRRIRWVINILIVLQIVGFLLYTISYHAAILVVSRFVCGMGSSFPSVITGEIFRIYDGKESTRVVLWMASMFSFGNVIGPSLNFMFTDVDFKIGLMEVNNLNFVGIFMVVILLIMMALTNFTIHDCSIELALKISSTLKDREYSQLEHSGEESVEEHIELTTDCEADRLLQNSLKPQADSIKNILKIVISNIDICLIFANTFVFVYAIFSAFVLLPIITDVFLGWNLTSLNFIYIGMGVVDVILLILLYKFCRSSRAEYIMTTVCLCSQLLLYCLIVYLKLRTPNFVGDLVAIVAYAIMMLVGFNLNKLLLRVTLAKMIPTRIQSFTEGLRCVVMCCAFVAGSLSAPLALPWLHWWAIGTIVPMFILLILFVIRRKQFIDPKKVKLPYTTK